MDSFYSEREKEKKFTKDTVRHLLPTYTLLLAKNKGKIHGYGIIKNLKRDFHMLFSPSEVYNGCWSLEEEGLLTSETVKGGRGKPRREYHLVEPKASKHIDMTLGATSMIFLMMNKMRKNSETDSLNFQVITPEAIRISKWRLRADCD